VTPVTRNDVSHLKVLSICYYVYAGLQAVGGGFALLYIAFGAMFLAEPPGRPGQAPPPELGWLFIGVGAFVALFSWTIAALMVCGGYHLARRRRYTLCLVLAGIACIGVPLGTVLGVFTFLVLARPSVREAFLAGADRIGEDEEEEEETTSPVEE
jgi:hypothetical protein